MIKSILKLQILLVLILGLTSCNQTATIETVLSNYSQIDSIQIHYKVYGNGDESLIFVHGWGCDIYAWSNQFDYFKDKYRLVFIDLPGYGKSGKQKNEYTIDLFAKSVKSVIDDLNIKNPTLIGHSMGFPVCRQVIRKYKDLDAKLCNIDGVLLRFPKDSIEKVNYKKELNGFASQFTGEKRKENVDQFIDQLVISKTPESVKEYALSTMTKTDENVGYNSMKSLLNEKYWKEDILEIPTLVVLAKTPELPKDNEDYIRILFPNTTYYEMEEVGHFLMMDKPKQFNKILEDFIEQNRN